MRVFLSLFAGAAAAILGFMLVFLVVFSYTGVVLKPEIMNGVQELLQQHPELPWNLTARNYGVNAIALMVAIGFATLLTRHATVAGLQLWCVIALTSTCVFCAAWIVMVIDQIRIMLDWHYVYISMITIRNEILPAGIAGLIAGLLCGLVLGRYTYGVFRLESDKKESSFE